MRVVGLGWGLLGVEWGVGSGTLICEALYDEHDSAIGALQVYIYKLYEPLYIHYIYFSNIELNVP